MKHVLSYIDALSEWSGKIVSFLLPIIVSVITIEVVMRYVFNSPTNWAHETTVYLCGALYLIAGAYVHRYKQHINMDIIYNHFSPRVKAIVDLCTSPTFFIFCGTIVWIGGIFFWNSLIILEHSDSPWGPPLYPVKLLIPLGGFLILLQGLANIVRTLHIALTGKEIE